MPCHGIKWQALPNGVRKNVGIFKLLENKLNAEHILLFHGILHQENLCKAALDLKHVIDPVVSMVNTIRARVLNHRQFKSLFEDMDAVYRYVIYHNSVQWMSLCKVLKRIWELKNEILLFPGIKEISSNFVATMGCVSVDRCLQLICSRN